MSEKVFDRETLLDLTVNVIPFGILVIFFVGYLLFSPWGFDSVISGIQLAIIAVFGIGLMILTYYSGAAVSKAEMRTEAALEAEETAELESGDETDGEETPE
ncbi:DUF6684 family protein [Salinibaculum salinum]|uniref:DUF6684 family protein n=1 Tax=Salinibaculum salinum TaxID=3131996 RepID=UPI0030EBCAFA